MVCLTALAKPISVLIWCAKVRKTKLLLRLFRCQTPRTSGTVWRNYRKVRLPFLCAMGTQSLDSKMECVCALSLTQDQLAMIVNLILKLHTRVFPKWTKYSLSVDRSKAQYTKNVMALASTSKDWRGANAMICTLASSVNFAKMRICNTLTVWSRFRLKLKVALSETLRKEGEAKSILKTISCLKILKIFSCNSAL